MLPSLLVALALASEDPPPAGARWQARSAHYTLHRDEDGSFTVDGTLVLGALEPLPAVLPWMTGAGMVVTETGGAAAVTAGRLELVLPGTGATVEARVRARVAPEEAGFTLDLGTAAPIQHVTVDAPGWEVRVADAEGGALRGSRLVVAVAPQVEAAPVEEAPLVFGEVAAAAWGTDDGAVAARARVRWKVLRGEVSRFRLDVRGLEEVELRGPMLAGWERQGDVVIATSREPVRGGFVVEVEGRRPLPQGTFPLPVPTPLDVSRVDRWSTLGRAAEGELVPLAAPATVPGRSLPEWARGLSDTPPLASWHGAAEIQLRADRSAAMLGPDTVVETARFVVATNADGRLLLRATWQVRNERSQYLHVLPGPGWRPMTARVTGDPVSVLADGAGGIYVPLEKSIETLQGLLAFPVEVTWIAEEAAWERRGERRFELPAVDAPIQQALWEVHLPRGYERAGRRPRPSARPHGAGAPPEATGIPDMGTTEVEADARAADLAEAALSNATRAYQQNDFEGAQEWLSTAKEVAPQDKNVDRLQSNLDVLLGSKDAEDANARRVLDLAAAKTVDAQNEQEEAEELAEEALRKGDEASALIHLETAQKLSKAIAVTEQRESGEQAERYRAYEEKAKVAKKQISAKTSSSILSERATVGDEVSPSPDEDEDDESRVVGGVVATTPSVVPVEAPAPVVSDTVATATALPATVATGGATPARQPRAAAGVARTGPAATAPAAPPAQAPRGARDDRIMAGPTPPPPPPPPPGRPTLSVTASPLTPALPLGTPAVASSSALLPEGRHPSFTIRYRRAPGDSR